MSSGLWKTLKGYPQKPGENILNILTYIIYNVWGSVYA